jgi:hypothetical protein
MREYQLMSPSLDGILYHDSIVYEGVKRPVELAQFMDGPAVRGRHKSGPQIVVYNEQDLKVIREYLQDLHRLFMKKFSQFMIETELKPEEDVKLQALLQEMIKVKKLI